MTQGRFAGEMPRSIWSVGRAMLAIVSSSTTMSCAVAMTSSASPRPRPSVWVRGGAAWSETERDIKKLLTELQARGRLGSGRLPAAREPVVHLGNLTLLRFDDLGGEPAHLGIASILQCNPGHRDSAFVVRDHASH